MTVAVGWVAAVLLGMPLGTSPAASEPAVALEVQPSLLELAPRAGESIERRIILVNSGVAPLSVVTRISDWTMSGTGVVSFLPSGPRPERSCAAWIQVEPERQVIAGRGSGVARVILRTPREAAGSHWAAILFELPEASIELNGRASTVLPRVGLTVYATPEGTERDDFDLREVSASASATGVVAVRAEFSNRGNTAVRTRLDWQIKSTDGKFVRAYRMASVVSLPGLRREALATTDESVPPGTYVVTAMARWGDRHWASRDVPLTISPPSP